MALIRTPRAAPVSHARSPACLLPRPAGCVHRPAARPPAAPHRDTLHAATDGRLPTAFQAPLRPRCALRATRRVSAHAAADVSEPGDSSLAASGSALQRLQASLRDKLSSKYDAGTCASVLCALPAAAATCFHIACQCHQAINDISHVLRSAAVPIITAAALN